MDAITQNTPGPNGNGQHQQPLQQQNVDMDAVASVLEADATVGYLPKMPLESLWMAGSDMPQVTLRRDLEFMQFHPIVSIALEYYKSGTAGTEFWGGPDHQNPQNPMGKPISQDQRVAGFVMAHCERFWRCGVPVLQEGGYTHGWAPGEHIYKEIDGLMTWSHLKGFHPNDSFILTSQYQPVGIRIKNIREKEPVDLWFASGAVPAKACWYAHRPRFNQFYGRSQLIGAWRPWRRLGWRDAVEQVIDAAVYRAGYRGPIVRHPMEDMQTAQSGIAATRLDGASNPRRSARDVARQLVEWAKAGAGFTLSSAQYPPTQGSGPKWDIEWPDHVMDVRPLIEAAKYLENQIFYGIGVPPELIKAGGVGSGYSGRSIPREAFLDGQQKIADAMLQLFVEQVIRPLVLWNFGPIPFEVCCKSILKSQMGDPNQAAGGGGQGNNPVNLIRSDAAKQAWQLRKQNEPGGGQSPTLSPAAQPANAPAPAPGGGALPMPRAFSLATTDPAVQEKILEVVQRALKRQGKSAA